MHNKAFTLLELMIVLAVVVVLAAIAVPSYRDFVLRSNRTEAMTALQELSNRQEEYYSNQFAYTSTISYLNYPATTPNDLYQLSIPTVTTVGYTLQATAINAQLRDTACRRFSLTSMGEERAQDSASQNATQECWDR